MTSGDYDPNLGTYVPPPGSGYTPPDDDATGTTGNAGNVGTSTIGQPNATVPGEGEVWSVDGVLYFVYYAPNTDPPVPLAWRIEDEYRDGYFGNQTPQIDRTLSRAQFDEAGGLMWGQAQEIVPQAGEAPRHPWEALLDNWAVEVQIRPWLEDPEIAALVAGAYLEGRTISDAELQTTEWWRSHTDAERQALALAASDPASYEALYADTVLSVSDALRSAGIGNASDELSEWLARQATTGHWSTTMLNSQIAALSDPYSENRLDTDLRRYLRSIRDSGAQERLDRTREYEDTVKEAVNRWLGPAFGNWTPRQIAQWAGTLRNDPDGMVRLEELLARQRQTLFPEYTNPADTYEDIASPWRNLYFNVWGEDADETDPMFVDIVRANDLAAAQQRLIKEGLVRGKETVVYQVLSDALKAFGGSVRGGGG